MTKNNIMSIAAAAALITSGAMAFETNVQGTLTSINGIVGEYNASASLPVEKNLTIGQTRAGDALIFASFNQADEWGTEIVVRNNEDEAIVAKFVAYAASDSQELRDFNIYLSPNDVFRCTIKDGLITTTDDSVNISSSVVDHWGEFENVTLDADTGYVVVYAMFQNPALRDEHGPEVKVALKKSYHVALDLLRPTWDKKPMNEGIYTEDAINEFGPINPPKIDPANVTAAGLDANLTNPDKMALSGTVRIFNATEPRDLIIPATGVENYSDSSLMLWAPRELAAWADRNLDTDGTNVIYNKVRVVADADEYALEKVYYTYNNAAMDESDTTDLANKLVVTQMQKRTLVQLGLGGNYWVNGLCDEKDADFPVEKTVLGVPLNGSTWGLVYGASIWDEEEHENQLAPSDELSPGSNYEAQAMCGELGEMANLEQDEPELADKNGYAAVGFKQGAPAIITQMTASQVGSERRINWISTTSYFKNIK